MLSIRQWVVLSLLLFTVSYADIPPQDQYLQLYLLLQEGEKLESNGQKDVAYTRYQEVANRLDALKKQNPDWEPSIVNYRIKYVADKLSALDSFKPTTPTPTPTPVATPAVDTSAAATLPNPSVDTSVTPSTTSDDPTALKSRINDLEKELTDTKSKLQDALTDSAQLRAKLDATEKELAAAKIGTTDDRVAALLQENTTLKSQLADSETQLKALQSGGDNSGGPTVPLMQAQLKKLQDQISLLQQENDSYKQTTADLKQQLDGAQKQIASFQEQGGTAKASQDLRNENEMLRNIVTRQLQEQARRDAAKKLAAEELDKLKIQSKVLREQIDILGSPLVALSDQEKALLRGPGNVSLSDQPNTFTAPLTPTPAPGTTAPAPTTPPDGSTPSPAATTSGTTTPSNNTPAVTLDSAGDGSQSQQPNDYRNKARIPDDMRSVAQEASDLFAQKRYDEAADSYQKILDKYPESLYAWSNLGVVRFQQQKYPEAEKALSQAIKLNPSDAFSHTILGIVYYQTGRYDLAVSTLTTAKALDPNDARTRNYLGIACSQKGWQEAAAQECLKAIELDPNYADPHFNLAVIYATQKPPALELARRHYKQALDLGIPKDAQLEKLLQP